MKKFLLFVWYEYQASGGMNDFLGSFDSIGEAKDYFYEYADGGNYFCQVVNRDSFAIVYDEYLPPVPYDPPVLGPVIERWEYLPTNIDDWG